MTRTTTVPRSHGSRSPENIYRRPDTSTPTAALSKRAFTKTVVNKQPVKGDYSDKVHKYAAVDVDESNSPLDTPAPRTRAPKPTSYDTSDIEFKARQRARSRSRSRSKSPAKKDPGKSCLFEPCVMVNFLKFVHQNFWQNGICRQGRPRSDCSLRSSLIEVYPVCRSTKYFKKQLHETLNTLYRLKCTE